MSFFGHLAVAAPDTVFQVTTAYNSCSAPEKCNLGVGGEFTGLSECLRPLLCFRHQFVSSLPVKRSSVFFRFYTVTEIAYTLLVVHQY